MLIFHKNYFHGSFLALINSGVLICVFDMSTIVLMVYYNGIEV